MNTNAKILLTASVQLRVHSNVLPPGNKASTGRMSCLYLGTKVDAHYRRPRSPWSSLLDRGTYKSAQPRSVFSAMLKFPSHTRNPSKPKSFTKKRDLRIFSIRPISASLRIDRRVHLQQAFQSAPAQLQSSRYASTSTSPANAESMIY